MDVLLRSLKKMPTRAQLKTWIANVEPYPTDLLVLDELRDAKKTICKRHMDSFKLLWNTEPPFNSRMGLIVEARDEVVAYLDARDGGAPSASSS